MKLNLINASFLSIFRPPGILQPPIVIRSRYEMNRIVTGLLPKQKYRFNVLAKTSRGLSTDQNIVEIVTSSAESKKIEFKKKTTEKLT